VVSIQATPPLARPSSLILMTKAMPSDEAGAKTA
jgi:hypothetical protein